MTLFRENDLQYVQRSYLIFENSIKSIETLKSYKYHLEQFLNFTNLKSYDELSSLDTNTIQNFLEDYVIKLKKQGLAGMSFRSYFAGIEIFLEVNKIFFYKKALHKMFPAIEKSGGGMPYTTQDIQLMLKNTTSKRTKALIHFFASTGARPAVLVDPPLKFKHVVAMQYGCKGVLLYANSKEEYWAFLSPESTKALDDYRDERINSGEIITQESFVFVTDGRQCRAKVHEGYLKINSYYTIMYNLIKKCGIERVKAGNRFDKAISYGFRKRFNTILKIESEINSNIAEKLMAHKKGLDGAYFKPTREQCFAEFVKAIHELTIDDSERLQIKLDKSESEKEDRIAKLENDLQDVYRLLSKLKNLAQ